MVALAAGLALARARRDPAWRRLAELRGELAAERPSRNPVGLGKRLALLLGRLAAPARPSQDWQLGKLRRELLAAGFGSPLAVNAFLGIRMLGLLLLPGLLWLVPPPPRLAGTAWWGIAAAGAALGYVLPGLFLEFKGRARRDAVSRELPEVLDLLVIAVEAGLGLDAAIRRVAQEVGRGAPILARELTLVSLELKAGFPREKAFKNLAVRCQVEDVTSLVNMLNQADRFGVSVGRSLRVHSDSVRTKWHQRMEEKAAKVPLKLLFPVLFMIFPAIMVVMAGPALIRVADSMFK